MKFTKKQTIEFDRRKAILLFAKKKLKKEFIGLDSIIDEVLNLIEPWYLFPESQIRPTIINLFGMTGSGKTSLVKRIFELIELKDNLYKFDIGEYSSQSSDKLSYTFSENLKNREKEQIGIVFDEFQLGRTIDENGFEIEKSGLRAMWELLDTGKISTFQSSYSGARIFQLSFKLQECIQIGGVEVFNGKIIKNKSYHDKYFKDNDEYEFPSKKKKKDDEIDNFFIPKEFLWDILTIWDKRFISEREIEDFILTLDGQSSIAFLDDTFKKAFVPVEFDFSTSCIFVIGNIDEAYKMSKNFDPDSDADRFYENSLKITLPHIKLALQKRFRSEQIARLGNNHIIYPAFSSKNYKDLISLELNKSCKFIKDKFEIDIDFHHTVNDIIYKEGVFPTQGARPIFTTISSIVLSYFGAIIKDIIEEKKNVRYLFWQFYEKKHLITFYDKNNKKLFEKSYDVKLKIDNLRESDYSELQAQVAVHEAGHAVAAIYSANILPTEIISRTANMSEGHCLVDVPSTSLDTKEFLMNDIIISIGGHVAEELVFGKDKVSNGTSGDFERISNIALNMAKSYGMLGNISPMFYGPENANANYNWSSKNFNYADELAEKLVMECKQTCVNILEENMLLLIKISEYLSENSRMDSEMILEFVKKYGKPVEIKTKDNYHSFKSLIKEKLNKESKF